MDFKLLISRITKKKRNSTQLFFGIKKKISFSILHSSLFFLFLLASISSKAQNCTLNANIDKSICANEELLLEGSKGGIFKFPENTTWSQLSGPSAIITCQIH
jgi:hypothetical protein